MDATLKFVFPNESLYFHSNVTKGGPHKPAMDNNNNSPIAKNIFYTNSLHFLVVVLVSFTHIIKDYFTGTLTIMHWSHCQGSNPEEYW